MSLITQCPACSTMFRVVPDQLRISEGWVRCGHCDEVFDANAHLGALGESTAPLTQAVAQPSPAPTPDAPALHTPPQHEDDYNYDLGAAWDNRQLMAPGLLEPTAPEPTQYASVLADDLHAAQGVEPVADLHAFEPTAVAGIHEDYTPAAFEPLPEPSYVEPSYAQSAAEPVADPVAPAEAQTQATAESPSPSFMRGTGKPPRRWISNGMAAMLCLVLLLALVVQVARQERDRLAAAAPALRPVLVAGCEWLECSVAPLREIESIAIDSSAFTSVRPGVYLLGVTLKNTAATELATPSLELTLTDMQDQPVLRRVLLANDWSGKPAAEPLLAGAERTAKLPISVPPDAVPRKIAGYKLLAFYP